MNDDTKKFIAETRREYFREYRKKNPEKIKAINERYWAKKALDGLKDIDLSGPQQEASEGP
jgi:hypothetical protein